MKKLLKVCTSDWKNESRDKRELAEAREAGFDVAVICKGEARDKMRPCAREGFNAYVCGTRPFPQLPRALNQIYSALQWAFYIKNYNADVLSCHDLLALQIGYLSNMLKPEKRRAKLVYDAHEFEMGRNTDGRRGALKACFIRHAEAFLMKRSRLSIMVNDTIAEQTQRIHGLKKKPLVVRNIPPYWHLDERVVYQRRREFESALSGIKNPFLLMYHGYVTSGRGIEELLDVVAKNPKVAAVILGYCEGIYKKRLKERITDLHIEDRVLFHNAVPHEILWQYVGAADVGMSIIQNICINHYYALPNKLFENIQSLTPVICSDFPELSRITKGYGIGLICNSSDTDDINRQVERLRLDKELYERCKRNLLKAKEELCWENERGKLLEAYKKLAEEAIK